MIDFISVSVLVGADMVLQEPPPPPRLEPSYSYKSDTGLLSPKGEFFPCDFAEHRLTFDRLREQGDYSVKYWDEAGFLHVQEGRWMPLAYKIRPTQPQIDAVFDWCRFDPEHRKFPEWLQAYMESQG